MGAKRGILIKSGEALEKGYKIDTVVFDKTGTITEGKPKVTDVIALQENFNEEDILIFAASLEKNSEHPLGKAIVNASTAKNLKLHNIENFNSSSGKGIEGTLSDSPDSPDSPDGRKILVGNSRFFEEKNILMPNSHQEKFIALEEEAKTAVLIGIDDQIIGIIGIADTLKTDAALAVQQLKKHNIQSIMMTGDNQRTAQAIAKEAGIEKVFAQVLPNEKAEKIKMLQQQGKKVAFVGDGINDAPALVQADIGIAIGTGTDIAIESGSIVLVKGNPTKVEEAIRLSKFTFRIIKQNLFWAFFYNIIALPLAAAGLLNPMIAAAAMALSSISVVSNSLRIRRIKFGR